MKLKDVNYREMSVDKKDILIVWFDYEYPVSDENIKNISQTISNIVNKDERFLNRVIFLPKGFEMESLQEQEFIEIWKSKTDEKFVDDVVDEGKDPNQMELFNKDNDVEVIEWVNRLC